MQSLLASFSNGFGAWCCGRKQGQPILFEGTNAIIESLIRPASSGRGGSRIPHRRGHQPSRGGAPTYDFAKISEKLHEIEKILGRGGGGHMPLTPLRSATELSRREPSERLN